VLGVARGAPDLAYVVFNHGDNRVVRQTPLARAIVVDEITNP
jgi:hypothetical protein